MWVKCLARRLTEEQRKESGASDRYNPQFQVTEEKEYLVLGISFLVNSPVYGNCCLFTVLDDAARCISLPSALFEVMDPRVSQYWVARSNDQFGLTLWPEEFYEEYFHDRVTDYEPEAVAALRAVVRRLESEFGMMPEGLAGTARLPH